LAPNVPKKVPLSAGPLQPLDQRLPQSPATSKPPQSAGSSSAGTRPVFCGDCGSHVYSHGVAYGAIAFIKAGTLDDPSWLAPNLHIWCAERLPWVDIPEGVTQAPANPT
jgi:hypothetical protein